MICRRVLTASAMMVSVLLAILPAAGKAFLRPPELFTLVVEPKIARTSQPRLITAQGQWLDNCPPFIESSSVDFGAYPFRLFLHLARPKSLTACTPDNIHVSLATSLGSSLLGELVVVLLSPEGRELATTVVTGLPNDSIEASRFSGLWFGLPEVNSLLMLDSSKFQDGVFVGLWGLFAKDGSPRWQTLHSSRRISSDVFEAKVVEYVAGNNPTPCVDIACPRSIVGESLIGTALLRLLPDDKLEIEIRGTKHTASAGDQPSSSRFVLRKVSF